MEQYGVSFDSRWYKAEEDYAGNVILSKWPSYVYDTQLSEQDPSRSLVIVEPINGINGKPILFGNLNLDFGLVNQKKRLLELSEALNILRNLNCPNIIVTRNFDYTVYLSDDETGILKEKGFRDSSNIIGSC